jgi:hypothetical protein
LTVTAVQCTACFRIAGLIQEEEMMTDLLDHVVQAHGGLKRWDELESVSAHLAQGGVTWEMVGQKGVLDDVFVTASLHEERVSHYPFGAAGGRSVFTPNASR